MQPNTHSRTQATQIEISVFKCNQIEFKQGWPSAQINLHLPIRNRIEFSPKSQVVQICLKLSLSTPSRYYVISTGQESVLFTHSNHTKVVICSIWLFSILVASPILVVSKIVPVFYRETNETLGECTEDWSLLSDVESIGMLYTILMFVLTLILPMVALTTLYGKIGWIVYKHQLPVGNDNRVTNTNLTQTKIKVSCSSSATTALLFDLSACILHAQRWKSFFHWFAPSLLETCEKPNCQKHVRGFIFQA